MLTSPGSVSTLARRIASSIRSRAPIARTFFDTNAAAIADAAREVAARLNSGGRIYAFGRGAYATDAQHVAVEFVHPVLVGKPALPASDLSLSFESSLPVMLAGHDVVVGFGPPQGDESVTRALAQARRLGAFAIGFPGDAADFSAVPATDDEHVHQEIVEITGHILYESVHVFLEHRKRDDDVGASAFLYPFLGGDRKTEESLAREVALSVRQKAADAEALRERARDALVALRWAKSDDDVLGRDHDRE